jgi:hypothetical protein
MRRFLITLSLCFCILSGLVAQNRLRMKNLQADEGLKAAPAEQFAPSFSRSPDRLHALVRFDEFPTVEQLGELGRQGARLVQYVPDLGFVFSIHPWVGAKGALRFPPEAKISAALRDETPEPDGYLVAEFFPDVDRAVAKSIAEENGFQVVEHGDLLPNHLLLRGRRDAMATLSMWDEVAYVFPASPELAAGDHVEACPGALTSLGAVGQYVATVGDGWDGKGQGSAELKYFFQRLTEKLSPAQAQAEIERALEEWARVASLSFSPGGSADQPRTLNMLFAAGDHGDGYPFDGQGKVLAHTFYPSPPNPEPIAGDLHFDDDEDWVAGPDTSVRSVDLFSVSLHELGHALGLGHSDNPGAVMYPYYRRVTALSTADVNAILQLYAAAGTNPGGDTPTTAPLVIAVTSPQAFPFTTTESSLYLAGTVNGGSGEPQVLWTSDRAGAGTAQGWRSWTIAALPLLLGSNAITITATDSASQQASKSVTVVRQQPVQPPAIAIVSPTTSGVCTTSSSTVRLAGTAGPAGQISRVLWTSSRGGSGLATGTSQWTTESIQLQSGANVLTLTAYDVYGATASAAITVTYIAAQDKVAPILKITSPASTSVSTTAAGIRIQGTAADNLGVTRVTWSTAFNRSGVASGTANWNTGLVPLLRGTNTIVIRAYDAAGNSGWRSLTVTRR